MCGIWLYMLRHGTKSTLTKGEIYEAFSKINERGPERSRFIELPDHGLFIGFHRLSIMDPSVKGDQPFVYEDDQKIIYTICNGEIYNYKELCEEFHISPDSGSDCEVLLFLYMQFGSEMIKKLQGEFAFCVCEINKTDNEVKLYIGRDQAGIRPLFISGSDDELVLSSELKGCPFLFRQSGYRVSQFKPRNTLTIKNTDEKLYSTKFEYSPYLDLKKIKTIITDLEEAKLKIKQSLIRSVRKRMMSDRPVGCLLSGGLDSSLVASVASQYCKERGLVLRTFSIGMEDSTDEYYARLVAKHIGSDHTHIKIPEEEWKIAVIDVIRIIESYDITTVRASTGQYLVCKWIAQNTDIKVLLIGDGSDELCAGYMYFHKAPSPEELHLENVRLVEDIHMYDVDRADRGVSVNGLEARVPFLDTEFIITYLSIDPKLRVPTFSEYTKGKLEKWLLRESFNDGNFLPMEVLYRKKEAFSDGVSSLKRSWYSILQEHISELISDQELFDAKSYYTHCPPPSKESLYFRKIFEQHFGININTAELIPYFWLPKWVGDISEPSARVLSVYSQD